MKKHILTLTFFFYTVSFLISCGGSDNNTFLDENYMGGTWTGSVQLLSDGCALNLVPELSFRHFVSQTSDSIDLYDDNDTRFVGGIVAQDGFSVDAPGPLSYPVSGNSCDLIYRYRYDSINSDSDKTAQVRYLIRGDCNNNVTCESEYAGSAARD